MSRLPLVVDDMRSYDLDLLAQFQTHVIAHDLELARSIVGYPWSESGMTEDYLWVLIVTLTHMAAHDLELARHVTRYTWFIDGLVESELSFLEDFMQASEGVGGLSRLMAAASWLSDGISDKEQKAFEKLAGIATQDLKLAVDMVGYTDPDRGNLGFYVLSSLSRLARRDPDSFQQLAMQDWFADGLEEEEEVLVSILGQAASESVALFDDLLQSYFIEVKRVHLPLAGEVDIWALQNTPFLPGEDLLATMEDTARLTEGFMTVPFPTSDIILLVVDPADKDYGVAGQHYGNHMVLVRFLGEVRYLSHETAHYYAKYGPGWFKEGGAEFLRSYVNHRTGAQDIRDSLAESSERVRLTCTNEGTENIRHLTYLNRYVYQSPPIPGGCIYIMGEHLLLSLFETIGEGAMSSAMQTLYLSGRQQWHRVTEEEIFQAFLDHTAPELREAYLDVYRWLHAGAYASPDVEFEDDHGDLPETASYTSVGTPMEGSLDYLFDFDLFRFEAQAGQKYRMFVAHETLRPSSVTLLAPDGQTHEIWNWKSRRQTPTGPEILWAAPASGHYYVAVQNFAGLTGLYTLTITPEADLTDDHGDTPDTATAVPLALTAQLSVAWSAPS